MKKTTNILICGDICPTKDTEHFFDQNNAEALFNDVLPVLKQADVLIGNMEFVITDQCTPAIKTGPVLHGKTHFIDIFKEVGFTALGLANNHIKDCGPEGVLSSLETCKKNHILTVGAGNNEKEAKKPLIIEKNGWKIGLMAFAEHEFNAAYKNEPGANLLDVFNDFDQVKEFKKQVDYLIVLYHGGIEYYEYPSPLLQKKCRKMVDSGADYVVCQHSHLIGTKETYNNGTILYGQGNTVFGYREGNDSWNQGLLVSITLSGNKKETNHILIKATTKGINLGTETEQDKIKIILKERAQKIKEPDFIEQKWKQFCNDKKALYLPLLYGKSRYFNKLNRMLHNKLIDLIVSPKKKMITHNLIRCESHNEVIQTILNNKQS